MLESGVCCDGDGGSGFCEAAGARGDCPGCGVGYPGLNFLVNSGLVIMSTS